MGFLAYFEVNLDFKEQFLPILKLRLISKGNLNFLQVKNIHTLFTMSYL